MANNRLKVPTAVRSVIQVVEEPASPGEVFGQQIPSTGGTAFQWGANKQQTKTEEGSPREMTSEGQVPLSVGEKQWFLRKVS